MEVIKSIRLVSSNNWIATRPTATPAKTMVPIHSFSWNELTTPPPLFKFGQV